MKPRPRVYQEKHKTDLSIITSLIHTSTSILYIHRTTRTSAWSSTTSTYLNSASTSSLRLQWSSRKQRTWLGSSLTLHRTLPHKVTRVSIIIRTSMAWGLLWWTRGTTSCLAHKLLLQIVRILSRTIRTTRCLNTLRCLRGYMKWSPTLEGTTPSEGLPSARKFTQSMDPLRVPELLPLHQFRLLCGTHYGLEGRSLMGLPKYSHTNRIGKPSHKFVGPLSLMRDNSQECLDN